MSDEIILEPDDRGRVSLAKLPGYKAQRYLGRRLADGSIILQPAVVLTTTALNSLLELRSTERPSPRTGRPLRAALDARGVANATNAEVEVARATVAERRTRGSRSLTDLTTDELGRLRGRS